MRSLTKAGGTLLVLIFLFLTVLRPLFANPALASLSVEQLLQWPQVLFYAPLLAVLLSIFVLAVLSVLRGDGLPTGQQGTPTGPSTATGSQHGDKGAVDQEQLERFENHPDLSSNFLSGQGGSRNRGFEIEEEAPEATLGEHLEHLQAELGDDDHLREELDTLEEVVLETEGERRTIPPRCPAEYCDALWTERTILGMNTGQYEVLEDGEQVLCLECESIHTIEDVGGEE